MNKNYLLTAAFAVMASLSGCSDTELASIDTAQEKTKIGFHTVGSQMGSRANIINSADITKTDFKVYAFDNAGNAFMGNYDKTEEDAYAHNGVRIMYDQTNKTWEYANKADIRYWPENTPLDFYAVNTGPVVTEDNEYDLKAHYNWKINKEKQQITYSCFDEYKVAGGNQNLDVMYAVAKNQTNSNGGKVNLAFKHILSQVLFKAKTNDDKLEVEINGIKFHNFQLGGTFTIPTGDPQRTDWSQPGSAQNTFTVGMDGTAKFTNTGIDVFTKPMLFVPQVLSPWVPSNKSIADADIAKLTYLEISCRIKQNDTYLFGKDDFKTLYVPFSATWEPGKRYVYTLIFGGGYDEYGQPILTQITFEPSVEDWPTDENSKKSDIDL